jgi:hypothetical protein
MRAAWAWGGFLAVLLAGCEERRPASAPVPRVSVADDVMTPAPAYPARSSPPSDAEADRFSCSSVAPLVWTVPPDAGTRAPWKAPDPESWSDALDGYVTIDVPSKRGPLRAPCVYANYLNAVHNQVHPYFADGYLGELLKLRAADPARTRSSKSGSTLRATWRTSGSCGRPRAARSMRRRSSRSASRRRSRRPLARSALPTTWCGSAGSSTRTRSSRAPR